MMGGEEDHFMYVVGEPVGQQTLHEDGWAYKSTMFIGQRSNTALMFERRSGSMKVVRFGLGYGSGSSGSSMSD
jgi:hypothetical protein